MGRISQISESPGYFIKNASTLASPSLQGNSNLQPGLGTTEIEREGHLQTRQTNSYFTDGETEAHTWEVAYPGSHKSQLQNMRLEPRPPGLWVIPFSCSMKGLQNTLLKRDYFSWNTSSFWVKECQLLVHQVKANLISQGQSGKHALLCKEAILPSCI